MISQTPRYALHILGHLAGTGDHLVPGDEIAKATGVPSNYLSKILSQLRKSGLVEARKGWGGGFRLREGAGERPIRDVVAAIDGIDSTERSDCAFGLPACDASRPCPLHPSWEKIRDAYEEMLRSTRIADLAR